MKDGGRVRIPVRVKRKRTRRRGWVRKERGWQLVVLPVAIEKRKRSAKCNKVNPKKKEERKKRYLA